MDTEFSDIPVVSTVSQFDWEECSTSSAPDRIASALKRRISRFSHGSVTEGLHNLAQHAIGELLCEPHGSFPFRTYKSVKIKFSTQRRPAQTDD
jgi:hypothetical protein